MTSVVVDEADAVMGSTARQALAVLGLRGRVRAAGGWRGPRREARPPPTDPRRPSPSSGDTRRTRARRRWRRGLGPRSRGSRERARAPQPHQVAVAAAQRGRAARTAATAMSLAVDALTNCAGGRRPTWPWTARVRDSGGTMVRDAPRCRESPRSARRAGDVHDRAQGLAWTASTAALSAGSMTGVDSAGGSLCRAPPPRFSSSRLPRPGQRLSVSSCPALKVDRAHKTAQPLGRPAHSTEAHPLERRRQHTRPRREQMSAQSRKCVRGLDPPDLARPAVGAPSSSRKNPRRSRARSSDPTGGASR